MATRISLRQRLRRELGDTTATPVWSEEQLNDDLDEAVREYGLLFPRRLLYQVQVTAGVRDYGAGALSDPLRVMAVEFPRGCFIPQDELVPAYTGAGDVPDDGLAQAWRWDGTARTLTLRRPPPNSTDYLRIHYLAGRALPAAEQDAAPVEAGDESLVVALAARAAWDQRRLEDAKRGRPTPGANPFAARAERLIARRRRTIRGA